MNMHVVPPVARYTTPANTLDARIASEADARFLAHMRQFALFQFARASAKGTSMIRTVAAALVALLVAACASVPTPPTTAPGPDFLAHNAAAKHVVTTASGLQYFVVHSGPADGLHPTGSDVVTFDYEGKLVTGETFDSSYERGTPLTGPVDGFVPGFTEALKLMRPGDEWIVWIPPALGYGDRASGPIPANSVLRFRLALHSVAPGSGS
jgi:FKBP-type peptidyl-prolyl cis-trans isomerase FklB